MRLKQQQSEQYDETKHHAVKDNVFFLRFGMMPTGLLSRTVWMRAQIADKKRNGTDLLFGPVSFFILHGSILLPLFRVMATCSQVPENSVSSFFAGLQVERSRVACIAQRPIAADRGGEKCISQVRRCVGF